MDIFRKIFGLNEENEHTHNQHPHNPEINEFLNNSDESDDPVFRRSFDVFTDTLQMQQYFEQEINDILKRFGFQGFREFSTSDTPNISSFGSNPFEREGTSQNLRDQFLKPGYIKPKTSSDLIDKDLDEKVKTGNFDSLVDEKSENTVIPYKPSLPRMEFSSLGFSESFKSVSKPDGSVETHRTVRDTQGNEETTVCHKIGDKEYCIIKKKDKQGTEETTEKFVNITEDEKNTFFKPKNSIPKISDVPWDTFFK